MLVLASRQAEGKLGLYRFAEGKLTALAVAGQTLPDGGKLSDIPLWSYGVSRANERGPAARGDRRHPRSAASSPVRTPSIHRPSLLRAAGGASGVEIPARKNAETR